MAELATSKSDHLLSIRCSIRLLGTARLIERRIDRLMRARFGSTISRFDFMAALDRHGALTLGELSTNLLVSNGNVTGLTSRLKAEGLIATREHERDRRSQQVTLTPSGKYLFRRMARAHAACIDDLMRGVEDADKRELTRLLDAAKASIRTHPHGRRER